MQNTNKASREESKPSKPAQIREIYIATLVSITICALSCVAVAWLANVTIREWQ